MRPLVALVLLAFAIDAAAQEPPSPEAPPTPAAPVEAVPAPPPSPVVVSPPPQTNTAATAVRASPSPEYVGRWRTARALSVTGSVVNVLGTVLSLTSAIYIGVTDWPPSASSVLTPAKPSDVGPALAYAGASASAAGFILNAAGLGYEHHVLDLLGADPGRGMFSVGTTLGIMGFAGVGASYFFGLTNYLNAHDQGIAILATSLSGTALCALAGILYAADSSKVKKAWLSLTTW